MNYRFHHVALLCEDLEFAIRGYTGPLAHRMLSRWQLDAGREVVFLDGGSDVQIGLYAAPANRIFQPILQRLGYGVLNIAFEVEDIELAREDLIEKEVEIAWDPIECPPAYHLGIFGPDRIPITIMQPTQPEVSVSKGGTGPLQNRIRFCHSGFIPSDLRVAQRFFEEKLGLRSAFEFTKFDRGIITLVDPFWHGDEHSFFLELIQPPYYFEVDHAIFRKRGHCYFHLGYDTSNVKGAFAYAVERGLFPAQRPTASPELGENSEIAFVYDVDGSPCEFARMKDIGFDMGDYLYYEDPPNLFNEGLFSSYDAKHIPLPEYKPVLK
jgi:catechol 2,3-dioxygenase-like lactoylglutathione lyase family enzyme